MKIIRPSFTAGELSPSLHSRVDIDKYSTGLQTARNMIVHPQGGISNRAGTKYLFETKDSTKKSRLIPFVFSEEEKYVLEFGEGYCRFSKNRELIKLTTDISDYDPSYKYLPTETNYAKIGMSTINGIPFDTAPGPRQIFVHTPFSYEHPYIPNTTKIELANSVTGDVEFTYVDTGVFFLLTIQLSTDVASAPTRNQAPYIQARLRAFNSEFEGWTVTQNQQWADNVPVPPEVPSGGYQIALNDIYGYFKCILESPGDESTHTVNVPGYSGGYWEEVSIGDTMELVTEYIEDDLDRLKIVQSADTLYIVHPSYKPLTLSRYSYTDWRLEEYDFKNGPFMNMNTDEDSSLSVSAVTGEGVTLTSTDNVFDTSTPSLHIDALFEIKHNMDSQSVRQTFTTALTSTNELKCGKGWRLNTDGTWTGELALERSYDGFVTYEKIRTFTSTDDYNVDTYGDVDELCEIRLNCISCVGTLTTNLSSDAYTNVGIVKIVSVASATSAVVNVINEIGKTDATLDWSEGSWSEYRGYPSCAIFFQDRLCFGSTVSEPQGIWMTKTGNYTDFGRSVPLVDSDGISVRISSRKINSIRNLSILNGLIAYTSSSEWSVNPGSSGNLTPTSIVIKQQGERGSNHVEPVIIGNRGLFFQPTGKILRDYGYEYGSDSFNGTDLTILSSHLFKNNAVVDFAFQQEPDSLVWCVTDDGGLLSLTYLVEQEVMAWTRHDTDGKVESICSLPGEEYDEIWMIVKRGDKRFIEMMGARQTSDDVKDQYFVDCGTTVDTPITVTGATSADPVVITAPLHGLSDRDLVDLAGLEGMTELNGNRYRVASSATNYFTLTEEDLTDIDGTLFTEYISGGVATVGGVPATITGATQTNPVVITAIAHGFSNGDVVGIASVVGMTELNGNNYIIANKSDDTFELAIYEEIDGSAYTAYTEGGEARLPVSEVSGLTQFIDGTTVSVLADGFVLEKTVASGAISLDTPASRVHVGLPYTSDFQTLSMELNQDGGTIQGSKVKVSNVTIRFLNSRGGYMGADFTDMDEVNNERTTEDLADPIRLFTGDRKQIMGLSGFTEGGIICYRQTDPLPVTILGVIPEMEVGDI